MRILHISDIHFREPMCMGDLDPDRLYRDDLRNAVEDIVERVGPVNAIAISGDIAFKGHKDEYQAATEWLSGLAKAAQCDDTEIYVVPGNHDVDRSVYSRRQVHLTAKGIFDASSEQEKENALVCTLNDSESSEKLLAPLQAYNRFASQFDCPILPDRPFWEKTFPIEDGISVKLRGMTSVFVSGLNGDDVKGQLYLGAIQTGLSTQRGIVNVAMAHHPVDWMFDADSINARLLGRPNVFLCGHKHSTLTSSNRAGALVLQAGSVNPERYETGWTPAFNLMEFALERQQDRSRVRVRTWSYEYQANPALFRLVTHRSNSEELGYFDHYVDVKIPQSRQPVEVAGNPASNSGQTIENPALEPVPVEVISLPQLRELIKRFWNLPSSKRRQVMIQMNELAPDATVERETTSFHKAILRISSRDALEQFETVISSAEGGNKHGDA